MNWDNFHQSYIFLEMLILAPPISDELKCPLFTNLKNCGQNIVKMTKDYENDYLKISCFPGREGEENVSE